MAYRKTQSIIDSIEARKAKIINAALAIIQTHGIEAVNVRALTTRARVSYGLVYKYHADIDELKASLAAHITARDLMIIREGNGLQEGIRAWLKQCAASPRSTAYFGAVSSYRYDIKMELAKLIRAKGIENSGLMAAVVYGAVIEAAQVLKPREETALVATLFKAMGARVAA